MDTEIRTYSICSKLFFIEEFEPFFQNSVCHFHTTADGWHHDDINLNSMYTIYILDISYFHPPLHQFLSQ